jgi:hypothetical protein
VLIPWALTERRAEPKKPVADTGFFSLWSRSLYRAQSPGDKLWSWFGVIFERALAAHAKLFNYL